MLSNTPLQQPTFRLDAEYAEAITCPQNHICQFARDSYRLGRNVDSIILYMCCTNNLDQHDLLSAIARLKFGVCSNLANKPLWTR
jgi:hypothetical protein